MRAEHLETPAILINRPVFDSNMEKMARLLAPLKVALRPHYKSHKSTDIAHLQVRAGAKGITCAKVAEAEDLALAGIEDILIVTNRAKSAMDDYFDYYPELETRLLQSGKESELVEVRRAADLANIFYVRQKETKGLGHAIGPPLRGGRALRRAAGRRHHAGQKAGDSPTGGGRREVRRVRPGGAGGGY